MKRLAFIALTFLFSACPPPRTTLESDCPTGPTAETCGTCSSDRACVWCASDDADRGCHGRRTQVECSGRLVRVLEGCELVVTEQRVR